MADRIKLAEPQAHTDYWIQKLAAASQAHLAERLKPLDVSVAQWHVLRALYGVETLSLIELGRDLDMDKGALSRMIDRLIRRGFVHREPDPTTRRKIRLNLTPIGEDLVPKLAREAVQSDLAFYGQLSEKKRAKLLKSIRVLVDPSAKHEADAD